MELKGRRHYLFSKSLTTKCSSRNLATSEMGWKNLIKPDYEASPVVGISK